MDNFGRSLFIPTNVIMPSRLKVLKFRITYKKRRGKWANEKKLLTEFIMSK